MVFFDADRKIVAIAANTHPLDETVIDPGMNAKYVLEINAGLATQWGLRPGDQFLLSRK